ncbi:hypothetical protein [Blastococcus brunescens]|uniref:DUF8129 domain-containing protein n=1 Tax=Blastococcus brunescens TaxID=1564165 RepID=A0ABZ1B7J8_9ACTN|nr:hypothetical protein [Blastococcus sp. BMG 8361]WRL65843.1 hypothetical protein U6N30_09900 [Blastococcus sp. BMG 8361]
MPERDLPLKDYDHLPVGSLASRIRTLGSEDLETLLAYERSHANRIQVVSAMEHRLSGLADGAQPSGGDPAATGADSPRHPREDRRCPRRRPGRRSTRRRRGSDQPGPAPLTDQTHECDELVAISAR